MGEQLLFYPVFKNKEKKLYKTGSVNIDIDTISTDLDSELWTIKNMELADLSWRIVIPRILKFFQQVNIKATFFIIGKHLELDSCRECINKIVDQGHEIGNHTMNHKKQFSSLSEGEIKKEILECHEKIERITGKAPTGFRAPGYTITHNVIKILYSSGYKYDASLNLSKFYNIVKWFYKNYLIKEKEYLSVQNFKAFPKKEQIYWVSTKNNPDKKQPFLLFPINVIPIVSYPFVSATLLKLGYKISKSAYKLIRSRSNILNFELHDIEFLKVEDIKNENKDIPYLSSRYTNIPLEKRIKYFEKMFQLFKKDINIDTFDNIARELQDEYNRC